MTTTEARATLQAQVPIFAEIEAWSSEQPPITKPPRPYARAAADILMDLSKPIAPQHLKHKPKGKGQSKITLTFLPWYTAIRYLDYFAPGWCHEVRAVHWSMDRIVVTVRLLIPTAEGWLWREATGTEEEPDEDAPMYGDPSSNAEAMAL
jgi:hypothetical protein